MEVGVEATQVFRVDPADGSCSVVAGNGTGGSNFTNLKGIALIPAAPLIGASAISDWGIALVIGILLGLSFRMGRRSVTSTA